MSEVQDKPQAQVRTPTWSQRIRTWLLHTVYLLEYALFWSIMVLFRALGLRRASDLGAWIARTFGPKIPVTRRAHRNLKLAMPELSRDQRDAIILKMWDNLGRTFAEYAHHDKFWALKEGARIEIAGIEHVRAAAAKGKGGFFVSGHLANWETMPMCIRWAGLEGGIVYRPPNNPYVDAWITTQRRDHGLPNLAAKGSDGARVIVQLLRRKAFVAMLVDQKMNNGIEVPFFGHPAMTTQAAALLSLKFGAPIVAVKNERLPDQRFRVTCYPEIAIEPSGDKERDIYNLTLKLNQFLEARIREAPEMWLWLHSRWPKDATRGLDIDS
jgi:Kdo2-lipid IVA lauroyltransferase/acyltransferase